MPIPSFLLPDRRQKTGPLVRRLREDMGLTQDECAAIVGITSASTVANWESGKTRVDPCAFECLVVKHRLFVEEAYRQVGRRKRKLSEDMKHHRRARGEPAQTEPEHT